MINKLKPQFLANPMQSAIASNAISSAALLFDQIALSLIINSTTLRLDNYKTLLPSTQAIHYIVNQQIRN